MPLKCLLRTLLVTSNFSFSHNIFHRYISLMRQNAALSGNGLRVDCAATYSVNDQLEVTVKNM